MLTRRQFLIGLGVAATSAMLPLGLTYRGLIAEKDKNISVSQPTVKLLECDWAIDNVIVVDGSGKPGYLGRVAVKGKDIVAIGDFLLPADAKVINGQGLVLAPGFIDIHTHTENYFHAGGDMSPFLSQGVTTQIGGNCGRSPRDIGKYFDTVPKMSINYGLLMGYATLRGIVRGKDSGGKIKDIELNQMQEHLYKARKNGAVGMSVGLEYWPQTYATTEELMALCQVLKETGGYYSTHIRSEYDNVLKAVEEAINIGFKTGVPVQYSHIKAGYAKNWSKFPRVLEMLEEAKKSGLDISADMYAYTYSSTDIGKKPFKCSISEENMKLAAVHPLVFFGSDSGIHTGGRAIHPRVYGNYSKILGNLVRENKVLNLEKAIAKMTSEPAKRLRLNNRGLLKKGYRADMVLFDPKTIIDHSTMEKLTLFSEGVRHVWVNGKMAWSEGELLNSKSGEVI
ncbi:MAG: D-aminoacylase [Clostridia bacterium]|nr:D-aminoacylase [Clostridia bacterium]